MAHAAAYGFLQGINRLLLRFHGGALDSVLEVGSYDVNGTARGLMSCRSYLGIDLIAGPGVDVVYDGLDFTFLGDTKFDLVYSTEVFEHDPNWANTFQEMYFLLNENGTLVFTCASRGRPEHGTTRTDPLLSPGTISRGSEYYGNLVEDDFCARFSLHTLFHSFLFIENSQTFDLYFVGTKGHLDFSQFKDELIASVPRLSLPHRIIRFPLYWSLKVLGSRSYDSFARKYWFTLDRLQKRLYGIFK